MAEPSNMSMPPPHHPPQVAVVSSRYCSPSPVDLAIVRKFSLTSPTMYVVTDPSDNVVLKARGPCFSRNYFSALLDAAGTPLLTLRPKTMSSHARWKAYRGESRDEKDLVFTIKRSSVFQTRKLHVFLANNTSEDRCDFRVEENWLETSCVIYAGDSNSIIAQMNTKHKFFGKDRLMVNVQPNVDAAFITAIIVVLDEINTE